MTIRTAKNAIAVAVALATAAVGAEPALVPAPRHMKVGSGVYAVKASNINDIVVHATRDKSLPPEGYRLVVTTDGVSVASADAAGAFYAHQTLRQLAGGASIPCVEIEDCPAYRWRGVHLDEVRHFFGKENVKRILDLMAYHKLNVFHWHLTDDEGWRLEIPKYPKLTRVGATRPNSWKRGGKPHKVGGRNVIDRNSEAYGPYFTCSAQATTRRCDSSKVSSTAFASCFRRR